MADTPQIAVANQMSMCVERAGPRRRRLTLSQPGVGQPEATDSGETAALLTPRDVKHDAAMYG
ncbi:hypothetical protein GCM10010176_044510 [Nonomuraea spiralis]|nr:hypothetical protein GCM10010176_044510 [Nonomuraea spiralis]